jgi:pilus assembly protein CpaE
MRAVVAGTQAEQMGEARRILLSEGVDCHADDIVGYDRLPDSLAASRPDVVLVFCAMGERSPLAAIQTAHQLVPGPVLAIGEPAVSLVRDAMRAGAREFIDVNNLRQDLSAAVVNLENSNQVASKRGRIVSVFSPIGGSGVSTIAINLAVSLVKTNSPPGISLSFTTTNNNAHGGNGTSEAAAGIALVDLNPSPSDMPLLLDLHPKHTLADVVRNCDRLDRRLLAGAMTARGTGDSASGLHVLPQPGFTPELGLPRWDIDSPLVRQLFVLLRKMYEYVVVDLGHMVGETQLEAMRLSNLVLLPVIADVPGLNRMRWAIDMAAAHGVSRDRFRAVLSRYAKRYHVNREKVEEALHLPVFAELIDDGINVTAARNEGTALVDISTKSSAAYVAFARSVQGQLQGPIKTGVEQ